MNCFRTRSGPVVCSLLLLLGLLVACERRREEPPAASPVAVSNPPPPVVSTIVTAAPPPALAKPSRDAAELLARLTAFRNRAAAQRVSGRVAFERDRNAYREVLATSTSREAHQAAWQKIAATWAPHLATNAPLELTWDDRMARARGAGRPPMEWAVPLGGNVALDLLWIDRGTFTRGSPPTEVGRNPDEDARRVFLTHGLWLARTEITQRQWRQVMGTAPSYFAGAGPDAPVEQVSWFDAMDFVLRLNESAASNGFSGVVFRLPTETEWEFACRADTETATYAGPLDIRGANHAPVLDAIAWYGGNSGVDYEGGWDSSQWKEKQHPHTRAGTHPVGRKEPNVWGFHDMLGNVWEWCHDGYGGYTNQPPMDPVGPEDALQRVARGGSWGNAAHGCRAALRNALPPDTRHNRVGFRVAVLP